MKTIAYFVIALLAVSCLKREENGYYILTTGRVEITQADIPDTATANQFTEINARAEESNDAGATLISS